MQLGIELLAATATDDVDGYRYRLVAGMAAAVVAKGYAATTIADIVRHARVSKRTFYEHFADKEECFLASYAAASEYLLRLVDAAAEDESRPWPERVRAAVEAYLGALQSQPGLTRALLLEVPAAGSRAVALRRRQLQRFADLLHDLIARAARTADDIRPLSQETCTALVGGINELILLAVEEGRAARLASLSDTAAEMISAVVRSSCAAATLDRAGPDPRGIVAGMDTRGVVRAGEGHLLTARGSVMAFKAVAAQTDGDFSLMERTLPAGGRMPPAHRHTNCSEGFFVLDGTVRVELDEQVLNAGAGEFVLVPRGVRHTFGNGGQAEARLLVLHAPAMDAYFEELHTLWAGEVPPTPEQERELQARYGMQR